MDFILLLLKGPSFETELIGAIVLFFYDMAEIDCPLCTGMNMLTEQAADKVITIRREADSSLCIIQTPACNNAIHYRGGPVL